ncbi:MAG TPA: YwqG family protein [Hyphomicrobiaceae bacterium]|nr:YwqG family protein [Hyphomicrobiaceae bacterium]
MTARASIEFEAASNPISGHVTKFGGQPTWVTGPQWPLSETTGNPMRFICQIALEQDIFPGASGKMAYVFMTDEDEYVDGTWEPDGGENAVIVQPGRCEVRVAALASGPSLYEMVAVPGEELLQPSPREFAVELTRSEEPAAGSMKELNGNKIGGLPCFLQGDETPDGGEWRLLLQLDSVGVPFSINFGDAGVGYAFIDAAGTEGKFLWQCC